MDRNRASKIENIDSWGGGARVGFMKKLSDFFLFTREIRDRLHSVSGSVAKNMLATTKSSLLHTHYIFNTPHT
jgi:hypothetical protein